MHRIFLAGLLVLALSGAASSAFAETFVEFNDGRYLKVRSHQVRDRWIRLELEPGASMVIPAKTVEIIERDRLVVFNRQQPDTAIALMESMRAAVPNKTVALQLPEETPGVSALDDRAPSPVGN